MAWHQRAVVVGLATVAGLLAAVKARLVSARKAELGNSANPAAEPRNSANSATAPGAASEAGGKSATREELYQRARQLDIPGRSRMTKAELQAAIAQRTKGAT